MVAYMAVMAREAWTDERMDDLKENVNQRFDRVDGTIGELRADGRSGRKQTGDEFAKARSVMKAGFERIEKKFDDKIEGLQAEMNARFDSMQRTMIVCFTGMTASIVASVIGAVLLR
jgi:hypothetical protein